MVYVNITMFFYIYTLQGNNSNGLFHSGLFHDILPGAPQVSQMVMDQIKLKVSWNKTVAWEWEWLQDLKPNLKSTCAYI
jgi:hypothetical protein